MQSCLEDIPLEVVEKPWSVLRVETAKEIAARDLLERQEVETYVPTGLIKLDRHGSVKIVNSCLFPGYLFARYEVDRTVELIATIPYVYDALRCAGRYLFVEDEEIVRVRALAATCLQPIDVFATLAKGTLVEVIAGNMVGCRGTFIEKRGRGRICCNVSMLGRSVSVEIDRHLVAPIKKSDSASVGESRQLEVTTLRRRSSM